MSPFRIQRYIISEISSPALLGMVAFSFALLLGRIPRLTEMIVNRGVPFLDIVELFSYLLPTFFSVTPPCPFCWEFSSLSDDSPPTVNTSP